MTTRVTVAAAQKFILDNIRPIGSEEVSLFESLGRTIARDYHSKNDIPPFDNSAMDGYAVSSSDVARAGPEQPVTLNVVGDLPAGGVAQREVKKGEAVRIMTGAPVPGGTDAVIKLEKTRLEGGRVAIFTAIGSGENIRRAETNSHYLTVK